MKMLPRSAACALVALLLALTPLGALAQTNWWSDIGPGQSGSEPSGQPEEDSALSWEDLFGGWTPPPDETPAPDGHDDAEEGDFWEDGDFYEEGDSEAYDDFYEEGDAGEDIDYASMWPDALFDPGVMDITSRLYGNAVTCAILDDWTITRGYFMDDYRITAERNDAYGRQIMADAVLLFDFLPAGDGIIYYGESTKGKLAWLFKMPGDAAPFQLPLTDKESVFHTDSQYIWYFTYGSGSNRPISRMGYDGKGKKQVGKVNATVIGMMDDGAVVAAAYSKNQVIRFQDGKSKVVYDPKRDIQHVITNGRSIWVQHEDEFGLLEDGELSFTIPGYIRSTGCTSDQMVLVVEPSPGAAQYDVLMFNEPYRAWARVGEIKAQVNLNVELMPPSWMTIWGPEESRQYSVPEPDRWLPFGQFERESAHANNVVWEDDILPEYGSLDGDAITRRVSQAILLESEAQIMADAKARGIYVTSDRDGKYTYLSMTQDQYASLIDARRRLLDDELERLARIGTIVSHMESEDCAKIALRVDSKRKPPDELPTELAELGYLAVSYQAFLYDTQAPSAVITLADDATGKILLTLRAPGGFMNE